MKMTPSEAFVETMVANNVTDIFRIMGSAFMDAINLRAGRYPPGTGSARTGGDPFRCDAFSKPVRLLEKYKDYV